MDRVVRAAGKPHSILKMAPRKTASPTVFDYLYNCTVVEITQVRLGFQTGSQKHASVHFLPSPVNRVFK